jgi:hypothetical protein
MQKSLKNSTWHVNLSILGRSLIFAIQRAGHALESDANISRACPGSSFFGTTKHCIAMIHMLYHEKYLMTKNIKYQSCNSTISIVARSDLQRENRRPAAVEQDGYVNNLLMIINSVQVPAAR